MLIISREEVATLAKANTTNARRTPISVEARENKLISMTMNLAEKQLAEGTASSQVMTHFLKLGTEKYRLERAKLEHETKLLEAKTEAIKSGKRVEELFENALEAMKSYSYRGPDDD